VLAVLRYYPALISGPAQQARTASLRQSSSVTPGRVRLSDSADEVSEGLLTVCVCVCVCLFVLACGVTGSRRKSSARKMLGYGRVVFRIHCSGS